MKCPRCAYDWDPKVPNPKECPRCKARLDYEPGPVGAPKIGKKGGGKEMASKIPWATALILIVAAVAVGTWAIYGGAPPTQPTPTPGVATVTVGGTNVVFTGATPTTSGIENIYFIDHSTDAQRTYDNLLDLKEHDNLMIYSDNKAVLEQTGDTVYIPADNDFDIVVAFKVHTTEALDPTRTDYIRVQLILSGQYTLTDNTTSENVYCFENDGTGTTWGRWKAVFSNVAGGNDGFTLSAGQSISIDNVMLLIVGE